MTIPAKVLAAFAERSTLSMPELAAVVEMDLKTLAKHRVAGNLPVRLKGFGIQRKHYLCTLEDVATFYTNLTRAAQPAPALETGRRMRVNCRPAKRKP